MKAEKDTFSKMISDKLRDYEVPYTDGSWSEMSDKLDANPIPAKPSFSAAKIISISASVAIVAAGIWYFTPSDEIATENQVVTEKPVLKEKSAEQENSPALDENQQAPINDNSPAEQNLATQEIEQEDAVVEEEIDRYTSYSEDLIREESEKQVNEMIEDVTSDIEESPMIDNVALKTSIVVLSEKLCAGSDIRFDVDRKIEGAKYYWDFGDKDLKSRKVSPSHTFKRAGSYTVRLNVSKGEIGSKNDWTTEYLVNIEESPSVKVESMNNQITLSEPYAFFEAISNESYDYAWTFNGQGSAQESEEVSFLIPDKGSYVIGLTASSANGCKAEIEYNHYANKGVKMIVEDAFTPNGDGINDEFMPKELKISNVDFEFRVMEMGGRVIFESRDAYSAWNGRLNNSGNIMPTGFYLWKVTFTDGRGKVHEQEGKIKLQ